MEDIHSIDEQIRTGKRKLAELEQTKAALENEIRRLEQLRRKKVDQPLSAISQQKSQITNASPELEKITLFRSLFKGREDVFARRFESKRSGKSGYQPVCRNEWVRPFCQKPKVKCATCDNRDFEPLTDEMVRLHLIGKDAADRYQREFVIGIYPMLSDETCWFLAVDFDKATWVENARAYLDTCKRYGVPAVLERSRSGHGGHIWIFFSEKLPAKLVRQLGSFLLTQAMAERPEMGFDSYDRFFPSQDTLPKGGFGNLIALPLQGQPRSRANTVFVNENIEPYGHLIVDECHHVSARSFEIVARQSKAKYVTGLSATVIRKDGHHPIIFMNCGPVRYTVDDRKQASARSFSHKVIIIKTDFKIAPAIVDSGYGAIHEIYSALIEDEARNRLIVADVLSSISNGRFPVILTERTQHLEKLHALLQPKIENLIVMKGGMGKKQRKACQDALESLPDDVEKAILATGRYLGEGFDDSRLDTLFLTMPISWKGTLAQYAGRLHRDHDLKKEVTIYDYADIEVPMLSRMLESRKRGYKGIGYTIDE